MARLTLPGVPSPSARSPRGLPPPALGSASAAAVGETAGQTQRSLPPRPQHRLRPPEPRLAPSLTDIRAPGAAGRAAPPWSPGSSAPRRPGALSGHQRPSGASAPPAAGSPLPVRPHFEGDARGARLPPRCPSSPGPPRRLRGGTARLLLRAARLAAATSGSAGWKPALQRPPRSGWDLGVLLPWDVPGVGAPDHRPLCFWRPLRGLPSETSGIRKQPFLHFAFSFESAQKQVFIQRLPSWGNMRITQKTAIQGSPLIN